MSGGHLNPVITATSLAMDMPDDTIRALSNAFGNFDRITALGWLLADAAGRPLLDRKAAYDVGLKAIVLRSSTDGVRLMVGGSASAICERYGPNDDGAHLR